MSGFSAQKLIDTAAAAKGVDTAAVEFEKQFKGLIQNSFVIPNILSPENEALLRAITSIPYTTSKEKAPITHDHPVMAALRILIRQDYEQNFRINTLKSRTLVVGSAAREFFKYYTKPNFDYYFHFSDGKDIERTIMPMLEGVLDEISKKCKNSRNLKKLLSKTKTVLTKNDHSSQEWKCPLLPDCKEHYFNESGKNKNKESDWNTCISGHGFLGKRDGQCHSCKELQPTSQVVLNENEIYSTYTSFKSIFNHYNKLRNNFRTTSFGSLDKQTTYNYLLFEDSGYNFGQEEYKQIFDTTGAKLAFGYMVLPEEFVFGPVVNNRLYNLTFDGQYVKMSYKYGYCNGYVHKYSKWSTIAFTQGIHFPDYNLLFEIKSRIGPFVTYSIARVHCSLNEHRVFQLTPQNYFVKVLNIVEFHALRRKGIRKYSYFPVIHSEFFSCINYLLSLKPASRTSENVISFIRHRMTGASLVNRELLPEWELLDCFVNSLAVAAFLEVSRRQNLMDDIFLAYTNKSLFSFFSIFKNYTLSLLFNNSLIFEAIGWLLNDHAYENLIIYPKDMYEQNFMCGPSGFFSMKAQLICTEDSNDFNCKLCETCVKRGILGKQKLLCEAKDPLVTLTIHKDELEWLRDQMVKTQDDTKELTDLKTEARKQIPTSVFSVKTRLHWIKGPFGTGKSTFATEFFDDLETGIIAPFSKLLGDYENITTQITKQKKNFVFKTCQHKAFSLRGKKVLVFDEFTSVPWEHFVTIVNLVQPNDVFLLGDELQTSVDSPKEGHYIGDRIDLKTVSTHSLLVNFRNARDVNAIANKELGYALECASSVERSIKFITIEEAADYKNVVKMAFTSEKQAYYEASSVRGSQGSTYDKNKCDGVILYVTADQNYFLKKQPFIRVAISRHKFDTTLYVALDESKSAKDFKETYSISDEDINKYLINYNLSETDKDELIKTEINEIIHEDEEPVPEKSLNETLKETLLGKFQELSDKVFEKYPSLKLFIDRVNSSFLSIFNFYNKNEKDIKTSIKYIYKITKTMCEIYSIIKIIKFLNIKVSFFSFVSKIFKTLLSFIYNTFGFRGLETIFKACGFEFGGSLLGLPFTLISTLISSFLNFLFGNGYVSVSFNFNKFKHILLMVFGKIFEKFFPSFINIFYLFRMLLTQDRDLVTGYILHFLNIVQNTLKPFAFDENFSYFRSSLVEQQLDNNPWDTSYHKGFCWTKHFKDNHFIKPYEKYMPSIMSNSNLMLLVLFSKRSTLNMFVEREPSHLALTPIKNSKFNIIKDYVNNTGVTGGIISSSYNQIMDEIEQLAYEDTKVLDLELKFKNNYYKINVRTQSIKIVSNKKFLNAVEIDGNYELLFSFSNLSKTLSTRFGVLKVAFFIFYNLFYYEYLFSGSLESKIQFVAFLINYFHFNAISFSSLVSTYFLNVSSNFRFLFNFLCKYFGQDF